MAIWLLTRARRAASALFAAPITTSAGVSYPLPARGKLEATGEVCEHCGAPIVVVETARGPWRICVNMDCPSKEEKACKRAWCQALQAIDG